MADRTQHIDEQRQNPNDLDQHVALIAGSRASKSRALTLPGLHDGIRLIDPARLTKKMTGDAKDEPAR
ncbi:MAG: hypothetical protein ACR2RE_08875 [Geminicoccaceae bacterium]